MVSITIHNLDDDVKTHLRMRSEEDEEESNLTPDLGVVA